MVKWADYLISGVWKSETRITHVLLHVDSDNNFSHGVKTSEAEVIKHIKNKKTVVSITWGYPGWNKGAEVAIEIINGKEILRTVRNSKINDNLDNLLPMNTLD